MSSQQPQLLNAALDNSSLPHQPYVVISDQLTFSGVPLMREMIRRNMDRGSPILLVSVLTSPEVYIPHELVRHAKSDGSGIGIVDLTDRIPGYTTPGTSDLGAVEEEVLRAAERLGPKVDVYIDSLDVFAEDYTAAAALHLVRALLKLVKANRAPSRLTILSCLSSLLFPSLLPPTLSSALTHLTPHPLPLLTSLSTAYLAPISAESRFLDLLSMAEERGVGERMVWVRGVGLGDWSGGGSGNTTGNGNGNGKGHGSKNGKGRDIVNGEGEGVAAVQVILRKATGGAKGMNRSVEGLVTVTSSLSSATGSTSSTSSGFGFGTSLVVKHLETILDLTPFSRSRPTQPSNPGSNSEPTPAQTNTTAASTHTSLNLPFNLILTDDQRRRRDRVPVPYVHEGEGVELGWEEEEEDEEI